MYFDRLDFDLLGLVSFANRGLKFGYFFKTHYFSLHVVHWFPGGRTDAVARHVSFVQFTLFLC